jgi:Family of unknown function (DUF6624)
MGASSRAIIPGCGKYTSATRNGCHRYCVNTAGHGRSLVGRKATQAAWLVLQHAISNPSLQRHVLVLLKDAAAADEIPFVQVAMLEDRIRSNEGRNQVYGTQFDWDEHGQLNPLPIEDEANVDVRRREIGLGPLAQDIQRKRELALRDGERPPVDWKVRQREKESWLRSVGWRTKTSDNA